MDLLNGLNPPQQEAVLHGDGSMLILAGAGSGKTRVLTHRIAHLIRERGVYPSSIIAITFTNKAAREMKERIEGLIGDAAYDMWIGTFHSMCGRILRRDIEKLGFDRNFVIYDSNDQQTLIKECIKELGLNDKQFPPKTILEAIGRAKDELIDPQVYTDINASDFRLSKIAKAYTLYQKKLIKNNALDFDDIILHTIKLLLEHPPVAQFYQNKFKYVLVDEYQDTNSAQYALISLLAQKHKNLCVVGDDDQSIYGWRGANIRNILDFEKEYSGCKVIKLEQNYRSSSNILDAANNVIKNNMSRKSKKLWTSNSEGSLIKHQCSDNEHEEAIFVASEIKRIVDEEGKNYSDFAILYRMNAQSRVVEERLMKSGIPYRVFGGLKFYDRKEVKDIIAYLRVANNPQDAISLKRIINVPKRGIGDTTMEKAQLIADERDVSLFAIVSSASEIPELRRAADKLESFATMIQVIRALRDTMSIREIVQEVIERSGYLKELKAEETIEAQTRIENIQEFVSVAIDYESTAENQTLEGFLEHISLVADIDRLDEQNNSVTMMTMHSAKGLEFPVVFIVGLEEGVFPGYRASLEDRGMEEERRLCYVGITRAKQQLYLTSSSCRTIFGNTSYNPISRFVKEIPTELFEGKKDINRSRNLKSMPSLRETPNNIVKASMMTGANVTGAAKHTTQAASFGRSFEQFMSARSDVESADVEALAVGDRVEHKKFGSGTITSKVKERSDYKLEISFDNAGMKRIMASLANLKKL